MNSCRGEALAVVLQFAFARIGEGGCTRQVWEQSMMSLCIPPWYAKQLSFWWPLQKAAQVAVLNIISTISQSANGAKEAVLWTSNAIADESACIHKCGLHAVSTASTLLQLG